MPCVGRELFEVASRPQSTTPVLECKGCTRNPEHTSVQVISNALADGAIEERAHEVPQLNSRSPPQVAVRVIELLRGCLADIEHGLNLIVVVPWLHRAPHRCALRL